ncbi:DNA/RNA non-specific endonuclease, partial [Streptacidiphilus jiangxiensis]
SASGNLYAYGNDNPVQMADPSGNSSCTPDPVTQPNGYPAWDYGGYGNGYSFDSYDQYYQYAYGYNAWLQNGMDLAAQNQLIYGWGGYGGGMDPSQSAPWLLGAGGGGASWAGGAAAGDFLGMLEWGGLAFAFSSGSCVLDAPPRPVVRPIDWHTVPPKTCPPSACTTTKQPGHQDGRAADRTRDGKPKPSPKGLPKAFVQPWYLLLTAGTDGTARDDTGPTCAFNGQGWVNYGQRDVGNGSRSTTMTACLNSTYLDTHKGTKTQSDIRPPGYDWAVKYAGYLKQAPEFTVNNCHLLARQMGGSGTDLENLVTCGADGNSYVGKKNPLYSMHDFENEVLGFINDGNTVLYQVTPLYRGARTVPYAFEMSYMSWDAFGRLDGADSTRVSNMMRSGKDQWTNMGTVTDSRNGRQVPTSIDG